VRLGPDVDLTFDEPSDDRSAKEKRKQYLELKFGRCVTLTSVNGFEPEAATQVEARTPHTLGPILRYGRPQRDRGDAKTFLKLDCTARMNRRRATTLGFPAFASSGRQRMTSTTLTLESVIWRVST
jgi:hypothetical protein